HRINDFNTVHPRPQIINPGSFFCPISHNGHVDQFDPDRISHMHMNTPSHTQSHIPADQNIFKLHDVGTPGTYINPCSCIRRKEAFPFGCVSHDLSLTDHTAAFRSTYSTTYIRIISSDHQS